MYELDKPKNIIKIAQATAVVVPALKSLTVYRYSVVIFTFAGPLGMWGSTLISGQSNAQLGRREECRICHYLA